MYDVIASQFGDALSREGKTIYAPAGTAYPCIFRKNSDKNNVGNRLSIYYPAAAGIYQGQILNYKDKSFIVLNKETDENDVYKKSDLIQTNTVISLTSGGYELNIKAYAQDVTALTATGNSTIKTVDGDITILTEDNPQSRALAIDSTFNALGASWKIDNLYYKDGIAYIHVVRVVAAPVTYTYAIAISTSTDTYTKGDTATLTTTCTATPSGGTAQVINNATVEWTSSDTSIATIDSTGTLTAVGVGSVTITARWVEHDVSTTKTFTIKTDVVVTYNAAISGKSTHRTALANVYTASFTDGSGAVASLTPAWSVVSSDFDVKLLTITYPGAMTISITVPDNNKLVGCTYTINLSDSNSLCSTSKVVTIK